jgi:hypothetical protein
MRAAKSQTAEEVRNETPSETMKKPVRQNWERVPCEPESGTQQQTKASSCWSESDWEKNWTGATGYRDIGTNRIHQVLVPVE